MVLTVNFDTKTATTIKTVATDSNGLYSILYNACFSNNVDTIHVINTFFVGTKIIKAVKVCLVRGIAVTINGSSVCDWEDLRPYQQSVYEFIESMNNKEEAVAVYNLILQNKELIPYYYNGLDELHLYLDACIKESGYDVSMSSITSYDKLSHGTYRDAQGLHEWSLNYTPKGTSYQTSLLDKLQMYTNIKWYKDNGFIPERVDRDTDIVVPVSACDLSTQMLFYGD